MTRSSGNKGELVLLAQIRNRAARYKGPGLHLGIGDDCALLRLRPNEDLAVTTDLSIAGRHFKLDWHTPESIGHRTLARGLSDLAAMEHAPSPPSFHSDCPNNLPANGSTSSLTVFSRWRVHTKSRSLEAILLNRPFPSPT